MDPTLIGVLVSVAAKVGAPLVKSILGKHVGKTAGTIAGTVIDAIAEKAGASAEELPGIEPAILEKAVAAVEPETPELIRAWTEQQREANRLMIAEMEKGPTWTWAWRPFWMWLLAWFWLWTICVLPIVNAIATLQIVATEATTLMTLTGAYLALYMGGHTIKDAIARWREVKSGAAA